MRRENGGFFKILKSGQLSDILTTRRAVQTEMIDDIGNVVYNTNGRSAKGQRIRIREL